MVGALVGSGCGSSTTAVRVGDRFLDRDGLMAWVSDRTGVETGMTEQTFAWEKFANNVMPRIPMRRWGVPEDFAAIACYIMSAASNWHTGDTFLIDGGYANF